MTYSRVGFAGEDCPKTEIPSMVGISEEQVIKTESGNGNHGMETESKVTKNKYHIDTAALHFAKQGMEVILEISNVYTPQLFLVNFLLTHHYQQSFFTSTAYHQSFKPQKMFNA